MKLTHLVLILSMLPVGVSFAQRSTTTQPTSATTPATSSTLNRSAVKPPTTRPAETAVQSTTQTAVASTTASPYRQQELYDQYHGINKKPTATAITTTSSSVRPSGRTESGQPTSTRPSSSGGTVSRAEQPAAPSLSDGSTAGVRIGLRGGFTRPYFLESTPGVTPAINFVGGLVLNVGTGTISFQPEINYSRVSTRTASFGGTVKSDIDRIELPLLLRLASGTVNSTRFFLNVGPYGAYASSASLNGQKFPLDGTRNRFSFGAAAGVGAALRAGPGHVTLELRGMYELGQVDTGFNANARTILAQGTVGYMVPLGR